HAPVRRVQVPGSEIGRPGRVAAGGLGRRAQVLRDADAAADLILDGTDPDADGAVALPAPPALAPAALLLGLLRDRLCVPVVRPETEHLDLRRLLDAIRAGHGRLRGGWLWAASTQVSIPTRSRGR